MAVRKIIEIDEEKCDGCGQCVTACAEGALAVVDGKAKVVNEVFCDGLGACLGECPQGALKIVERESPEFDEEAVKEHLAKADQKSAHSARAEPEPCGCPSASPMALRRSSGAQTGAGQAQRSFEGLPPELANWPVQWRLVQPASPFFKDADILLSADCVPFAYRDFHERFLAGKPVVIGCPKLDDQQAFLDKLTALVKDSSPRSLTVLHMEVPCCSGLLRLVEEAVRRSGKEVPIRKVMVGIRGEVLSEA